MQTFFILGYHILCACACACFCMYNISVCACALRPSNSLIIFLSNQTESVKMGLKKDFVDHNVVNVHRSAE